MPAARFAVTTLKVDAPRMEASITRPLPASQGLKGLPPGMGQAWPGHGGPYRMLIQPVMIL